MRRAIAIFAFLCAPLIGAVPPGHAQERWTEYRSPAGGFRAEFPGAPQHDAEDVSTAAGSVRMNETRLTVSGVPARRAVVDIPEGKRVGHVLLVLSGNRLLQAIYVGPNGTENTDRATRFLNSLALIAN